MVRWYIRGITLPHSRIPTDVDSCLSHGRFSTGVTRLSPQPPTTCSSDTDTTTRSTWTASSLSFPAPSRATPARADCRARQESSLVLLPPRLCTVGTLPELLYESKRPFASDLLQQLVWVQALNDIGPARSGEFMPQLPAADDFSNWMDLGRLLQRQHRELAADALGFAEVARRGKQLAGFQETGRWKFLGQVQDRYLAILDQLGLWDLQTARLFAIRQRECRTDNDIILVGTTDMNVAMRRMLDQVSDRVTALIHAPDSLADHFDEHGCLNPDAWQETAIDLKTEQIRIVEGPAEQADAVVETIASFNGRYRADEIVVGVLDEQLVPQLLRRLQQAHLPSRWVVGKLLRETAPYRLLEALARYVDRRRFADFAALVRHPDVGSWLASKGETGSWLARLDEYYNQHLPPRLGQWLGPEESHAPLRRIVALVHAVIQPLEGDARSLPQWSSQIAQLLSAFYGERVLNIDDPGDHYTLKSLEQLREALLEQQRIPAAIAPPLTAREAIELLLVQVHNVQIPSPRESGQIELLGWLELPLDTAPALIATSFNEGRVPTSVNSDLFLPNALRQQLELLDNRRRYARDAYALSALQASRSELTLIAGRHTADNDPLTPSRLAFATDPETVARRAMAFFRAEESPAQEHRSIHVDEDTTDASALIVRKPPPLAEPITSISVTAFRTYLACPYRFYLSQVLNLGAVDDATEELGADTFGTLLHEVLSRFGHDPICHSTDPQKIRRFLHHALNQIFAEWYGTDHLPAVTVQIAQAHARLAAFADWQARRAAEGWKIIYTETSGGDEPARLTINREQFVTLRGRIDRIDRKDDQWAVFDYKTGDRARTPKEMHVKGGEWIDLQLPLYVHLARTLGIEGTPQLGYIVLPKEVNKTGELMVDWDEAMLATADDVAIQVAENIVNGIFWPPTIPAPRYLTDFAVICQDHAFRPRLEGDARKELPA